MCPNSSSFSAKSETDAPSAACSIPCVSRRGFLQLLAAGAGVALLGGCGSSDEGEKWTRPEAVAVGDGWQIEDAPKLEPGEAFTFEFPDQAMGIVFITKAGELRALSAVCTHAACTVRWQDEQELFCPCHGSRFNDQGQVLNGPATEPLPRYSARLENGTVHLKKG